MVRMNSVLLNLFLLKEREVSGRLSWDCLSYLDNTKKYSIGIGILYFVGILLTSDVSLVVLLTEEGQEASRRLQQLGRGRVQVSTPSAGHADLHHTPGHDGAPGGEPVGRRRRRRLRPLQLSA